MVSQSNASVEDAIYVLLRYLAPFRSDLSDGAAWLRFIMHHQDVGELELYRVCTVAVLP